MAIKANDEWRNFSLQRNYEGSTPLVNVRERERAEKRRKAERIGDRLRLQRELREVWDDVQKKGGDA